MPESGKNPKPEKCFSKPQNPHHPLHALLARFLAQDSILHEDANNLQTD
jgi:hypothetical protein